MGGENEAQRRGDVRFSFPDPEHFQWKLGIQLLIPCCNHCVTCLCLKVTTTAKSKAAELGGCWRTFILCSGHHIRRFSKSCPSASSTENGCIGPDQRLGLLSILLPTVAINGCPKGENKNRISTYNTPVSLFICLHPSPLLPPPVTPSSLSSWRGFCLFSGNPLIYLPFIGPLPHKWWKLLVPTISLTTTSCTGQHLPKEPPTSDLLQLGSYHLPLAPPHPCVTRQWTIPILQGWRPAWFHRSLSRLLSSFAQLRGSSSFSSSSLRGSSTPLNSLAVLLWALGVCKSLEREWREQHVSVTQVNQEFLFHHSHVPCSILRTPPYL